MAGYGLRGYGLDGYGISAQIFERQPDEELRLQDSDIKEVRNVVSQGFGVSDSTVTSISAVRSEKVTLEDRFLQKVATFVKLEQDLRPEDQFEFNLSRSRSQSISIDDSQLSRVIKALDEDVRIADDLFVASLLEIEASVATSADLAEFALQKPRAEDIGLEDEVDTEGEFFRDFSASVLLLDSDVLDLGKPLTETAGLVDADARSLISKPQKEQIDISSVIPKRRIFLKREESLAPVPDLEKFIKKPLKARVDFSQFIQLQLGFQTRFQQGVTVTDSDVVFSLRKTLNEQVTPQTVFDRVFEGFRTIRIELLIELGNGGLPILSGDPIINLRKSFEDQANRVEVATRPHNEVERR